MRRKLIVGNWKMHGQRADGVALARDLSARAAGSAMPPCDLLVCPPATLISLVGEAVAGSPVLLGAQDCHQELSGAHTGDISAAMLKDLGCRYVIVGHSERREHHCESDQTVRVKADTALSAGLSPIVCLGETLDERKEGRARDVVAAQLRGSLPPPHDSLEIVIAYEPVWAIGTGHSATPDDAQAMHAWIRGLLAESWGDARARAMRILYGGSVKPDNAASLMAQPEVDGGLVGGASLTAESFWSIVESCS